MAIRYNSLLNKDWYARLLDQIKTGVSSNVRATGSEADDPFWRAREGQAIGDLNAARREEFRRLQERGLAARAESQEREKARQRVISRALAAQYRPSEPLGSYSPPEEAVMPIPAGFSATRPPSPAPSEAYAAPYSGALKLARPALPTHPMTGPALSFGVPPAYNPSKFASYDLEKRRKELEAYYAKLANRQGRVAVY